METLHMTTAMVWSEIQGTLTKVLCEEEIPNDEWQDLFGKVHNLFTWDKNCDDIFVYVKKLVETTITKQKLLMEKKTGVDFLAEYDRQYRKTQRVVSRLQLPFHKVYAAANRILLLQKITGKDPIFP
ncbi:hypothetical protein BIW11_06950, partial [Tropilaelaps mercedesae]